MNEPTPEQLTQFRRWFVERYEDIEKSEEARRGAGLFRTARHLRRHLKESRALYVACKDGETVDVHAPSAALAWSGFCSAVERGEIKQP